jgi:NDP-sugar pyrophosphorylase family protein
MHNDTRKAMILAAGEGSRLRPLTLQNPKVLLPIAEVPLIQYTLFWLKSHGIQEVAVNLYHLGAKIKDFLGDGSQFGMRIHYSLEETLLGTAGGIKRMEPFFDGTFAVVYGDVLTNFDLSAMSKFHRDKRAIATIALFEASAARDVGIVVINAHGKVIDFVEKPKPLSPNPHPLCNGGIYILEKEMLDYIPGQVFCDFAYDIFPKLVGLGLPVYGYIIKTGDYLIDIGSIDKYQKANQDMRDGRVKCCLSCC